MTQGWIANFKDIEQTQRLKCRERVLHICGNLLALGGRRRRIKPDPRIEQKRAHSALAHDGAGKMNLVLPIGQYIFGLHGGHSGCL